MTMSATIGVESVAASMASAMALAEIVRIAVRSAGADDVQVQDDHGVRGEAALRLLLHVLGHLGVGEAEGGILGELGLGHRGELAGVVAGAAHVVHAADGDAAGVGEGGNDHDAVGLLAADGGDGGGDDVRFERVVAAEGGVAAADEPEPELLSPSVAPACAAARALRTISSLRAAASAGSRLRVLVST